MTKTLTERIAERMGQREPSSYQRNRAAFLALRSEIRTALEDGWSMRAIWETLHAEKRLAFGYDAFTVYVKKLIKQPNPAVQSSSKPAVEPSKPPEKSGDGVAGQVDTGPVVGKAELPSFRHNPNRDKKDLI